MSNLFDLSGKVAIVVGGHGGIGRAQALGLADAGADVVVSSRSMDQLNEVNTDDVEPTAHVLSVRNVLRDDEAKPSPDPAVSLANAPETHDSFFRVPKVLDQDSA